MVMCLQTANLFRPKRNVFLPKPKKRLLLFLIYLFYYYKLHKLPFDSYMVMCLQIANLFRPKRNVLCNHYHHQVSVIYYRTPLSRILLLNMVMYLQTANLFRPKRNGLYCHICRHLITVFYYRKQQL